MFISSNAKLLSLHANQKVYFWYHGPHKQQWGNMVTNKIKLGLGLNSNWAVKVDSFIFVSHGRMYYLNIAGLKKVKSEE